MIERVRGIILNQDGHVLMGRSPSGEYGIPGGGIGPGEDELDALIRELREECALELSSADYIHPLFRHGNQQIYLVIPDGPFVPDCFSDPDKEFDNLIWAEPGNPPKSMYEDAIEILYKLCRIHESESPMIVSAGLVEREQGSKILISDDGASGYSLRAVLNRATKSIRVSEFSGPTDQVPQILDALKKLADQYSITTLLMEANPEHVSTLKSLGFKKAAGADSDTYKLPLRAQAEVIMEVDGKEYKFDDDEIWQTLPRMAQEQFKGKKIKVFQRLPSGEVIDFSDDSTPWGGTKEQDKAIQDTEG